MNEVVMHPRIDEGRARQAQRDLEASGFADQQRDAFDLRINQRALMRHAKARMKDRPRMHQAAERRRVGENLWNLLDEIERGPRGISKARVLQRAIDATPEDSTKHLPRYACRPSKDAAEADRRTRLLVKSVAKFVEIARAAAELAGIDPDEATLRVLEGTFYTQDPPVVSVEDDRARRADSLAVMLADIAERLRVKHRVVAAAMRRVEAAGWVLQAPGDLTSPMKVGQLLLANRLDAQLPPLPLVALYERFPHVHLGYVGAANCLPHLCGHLAGWIRFEDGEGTPFDVQFADLDVRCDPVFRVDLVLAPSEGGAAPELVFAFRLATWVRTPRRVSWTAPCGTEYAIAEEDVLGEIESWLSAREGHAMTEPAFGMPLRASQQTRKDRSWTGSFILRSDAQGKVPSYDSKPPPAWTAGEAVQVLLPQYVLVSTPNGGSMTLCDQPLLQRRSPPETKIAHLWTDECPRNPPDSTHEPTRAPTTLEPVEAPEGSLSARLERWLAGSLANRAKLEADLDAAILAFLARVDATLSGARDRLTAAVYGMKQR